MLFKKIGNKHILWEKLFYDSNQKKEKLLYDTNKTPPHHQINKPNNIVNTFNIINIWSNVNIINPTLKQVSK
jgi:hypothetical protein